MAAAGKVAVVAERVAVVGAATRKRRLIPVVGSTEEYQEECCLGEGGFGAVVKARHRATGQAVAIKHLTSPDAGRVGALLQEAAALQDCGGNPFVVGYHGLARDPATSDLCLVMECAGPALDDVLREQRRRRPPLPEATVRAAMWQLLTGAKKMHERHIVHRDIKTENILVADDRTVLKICDFGLAMPMSAPPPYGQAGTTRYMAPEMLLGMPDYDALVDTWSLGCVMAELIGGRSLFTGMDEDSQLCAIFEVLGAPDGKTWPWFSSTAFATKVLPGLYVPKHSRLRDIFPAARLSNEGFEVLKGLLTCNPDKRLTAAAALKHRWFAKVDPLALPRKEEVALPKKKELLIIPPALPKRRRLLCA
ncbi:hypothetical protein ACP70R_025130 [Stipagrostis hirtigluma subsp. patula]